MSKVLDGFLDMFHDHWAEPNDMLDCAILKILFIADPSAAEDLAQTIFLGQHFDMSVHAEAQQVLDILGAYGVIEQADGNHPEILKLKFHARPLIKILKCMPHRNPVTGLLKFLNLNS
jgi:hypothetical protein